MKLNPNAVDILNDMSNKELAEGIGHATVMFVSALGMGDPILDAAFLVLNEAQKRIAALDK